MDSIHWGKKSVSHHYETVLAFVVHLVEGIGLDKENQPPDTNKANLPQARESNDHSSVRPESSTSKQAGNTQLENEPQACEQLVLTTVLSEVQKTNSRLESFEERLGKLEESVHTPSSSSSGTVSDKYKRTLPIRVRVRVCLFFYHCNFYSVWYAYYCRSGGLQIS